MLTARAPLPSLPRVLVEAARPRTLPAGVAPVLYGTAFAVLDGGCDAAAAIVTLLAVVALQVGANYANDYFDAKNGADTDERIGPRRATQAGLVAPSTMRRAFVAAFACAAALGALLAWRGGWPIAAIGVAAVAAGVLYTGGPRPFGYAGLGDVVVLVFFGPVAVAGTHYLQGLAFDALVAVAGLGPGLLSVAVLTVNNLRDRGTDARANKRTLAVRLGATFTRAQYALCAVLGVLVTTGVAASRAPAAALGLVALPLALALAWRVATTDGPSLNRLLGRTAQLLLFTTALTAAAMAVSR